MFLLSYVSLLIIVELSSVQLEQLDSLVLCAFGSSTMMGIAILVLEYCEHKHGQIFVQLIFVKNKRRRQRLLKVQANAECLR